jgi:uncharacterized protein DUF3617
MKTMLRLSVSLFLLTSALAQAVNPPAMKEGLWSIRNQSAVTPENKSTDFTSTICRNHAYDQHVLEAAKTMKGCSTVSESMKGSNYSIQTHCVVGKTVIDTTSTVIFKGDAATHSETHATYTPAMSGVNGMTLIQDQQYLGSCPAGAQPGDMTRPDGTVVHLWKH